jgi:hypothetical protein
MMMRPDDLNEIEIPAGIDRGFPKCCRDMIDRGYGPCVTMFSSQEWDMVLEATYGDSWTILELNSSEELVRAFRKPWN